jgi:hypothetical protein
MNPIGYVMESMTPLAKRDNYLVRLKLRNHMALTNLTQGKATRTDMDDLIAMGNVTEALYRMGFGKEHGDITQDGLGALLAVGKRGAESGRFILRAPEMAALNLLMDLHEAQMDVVTTKDMEQGLKLVDEEFRQRKMRPIVEKK